MTRSGAADLALLTGDGAAELLSAVLAPAGGRLAGWSVRTAEARDGVGATASYRAQVRSDDGEGSVLLAATTRPLPAGVPPPAGVLQLPCGDDRRVLLWRWPQDPWLPTLPLAGDAGAVQRLLGVPPAPDLRLRVRTYRPTRRAVVQGSGPDGGLFVKVVRPERAADLRERHALLATAGLPVPVVRAHDPRGLLVLGALPGTPLRDRLRDGGPVPSGAALLALLDRLPAGLLDLPRRPAWSDAAAHYAALLDAALTAAGAPEAAARARALADAVTAGLAGAGAPVEPVHGDLYEGQLLVGPDGAVTGLLDVDGAGPGRRADDLACLLAHLDVLADREPAQSRRVRQLQATWRASFADRVDPRELRLRTAGVLLSLATGPHRVQERDWPAATLRRLDLARRTLEQSDRC